VWHPRGLAERTLYGQENDGSHPIHPPDGRGSFREDELPADATRKKDRNLVAALLEAALP
jgi:hypothetical protein